jgi:RNA polymerase sigma-70 factor (ECF subfamily)
MMFAQGVISHDDLLERFRLEYNKNKDFVRYSIYHMVRSDVVDDLVQDTFVKAWKNYKKFKYDCSFKTWIYRIAMNTTYDYFRKHKHITQEGIENEYKDDDDFKDLVTKGLMRLTIKQREVFILYYKLGYTMIEIANLLNVSEGTVKSRIHYAKNEFVIFLKDNGVHYE